MTGWAGGPVDRWRELDADLAAQVAALRVLERRAEAAERGRAEVAQVLLADRLRAGLGRSVVLVVRGAGPVRGALTHVGRDHVRVEDGARMWLLPLVALLSVGGLGPGAVDPGAGGAVGRRLGLASALRDLTRDRAPVRIVLDSGDAVHGTIDAVGADHLDLAEHAVGEARRRAAVRGRRIVPFAAVAAVVRG